MSKKILRPHQESAVKDILEELQESDRTTFVSATGTGKTISLQAIAEATGDRVVAFFPSIMLVNQTIHEWREQYGEEFRAVAVCSDETVGQLKKHDDIIVDDSELREEGAEVTRDPERIAEILSDGEPVVVFATYHSADKISDAQEICGEFFDIAIADEAHYLAGVNPLGRVVLESGKILAKKRVFATATPKIVTLKQSHGSVDREIASMDDESVFGRHAHTLDLRAAIDMGILVDYQIYIVEVSQSDVEQITGSIDPKDAEMRMALGLAAYERMKQDLGVKRSVIYLSSKARARDFAQAAGSDVDIITGEMPAELRKNKLTRLAAAGGAITNVRCLTEGVDLPTLDAVEFVDPRSSKIDIVQAIGRAVRTAPSKEKGYVILPVLEEPVDDSYGTTDTFKPVWQVISQMAENDTALSAQISYSGGRAVATEEEKALQYDKIIQLNTERLIEPPETVDYFVQSLTKRIELRAAAINDPLGSSWRESAEKLLKVEQELGRLPYQSEEMGKWLSHQRRLSNERGAGLWTPERQEYMDSHFPEWQLKDADEIWFERAHLFLELVQKLGRLPYTSEEMGKWLTEQRMASKGIGTFRWTPERQEYMDSHFPGWNKSSDEIWLEKASQLKKVFSELGRLPYTSEEMGKWLSHQKQSSNGFGQGKWTPERQEYMDSHFPGWNSSKSSDDLWLQKAQELKEQVLELGRLPRAKEHMARWLYTQRDTSRGKTKGKWTPERQEYMDTHFPGWLG